MTVPISPKQITPLPPAPSPEDSITEFNSKAFNSVAAQGVFVTEANKLAMDTFTNATASKEGADAASLSAAAALQSKNEAANSVVAAGAAANAAGMSAAAAAQKADAAAASADDASRLNLGPHPADPTTDNAGRPILTGATYFNTTTSKWKVYNGTQWADGISDIAGVKSVNGMTGIVDLRPQMHATALYF